VNRFVAGLLLSWSLAILAHAQDFPSKSIRVLVSFAPGGVVDTSTRIVTGKITEAGWRFVVENRPGANGFIGAAAAAKANPDGYTLLSAHTGEFAVNPAMFKSMPYDEQSFLPVIMLSDAPMLVVVNAQSPINSIKELIAAARAKPGAVTFGSPGTGSVNHMASEWLAAAAVATNDVTFTVAGMPGVFPHLQSKRVKVLGVTTAKRSLLVPDYPTAQEMGVPGVDASIWVGLFVPRGTPAAIISKIYHVSADALKRADVQERLAVVGGAEAVATASAAFHARIASDLERYKRVAQQVGIKPE
jgi:tripartite-type tricarboxylate transporter receptor subunit TctC